MANEIRLRSNNMQGAITDNPLTNVATTINSPGFVDLPSVNTTNHLILILDPLETNGPAEIVTVTAHTAASSVVTVTRGAEGSAARTHAMGTAWFHGPIVSDYNFTQRFALSTNRPITGVWGELIYETDTNRWSARSSTGPWFPAPHNVPTCRVYHSASQSINNITATVLAFDSERFDTDSMHNTVTNNSRITFNTAGVYQVEFGADFANNATGFRQALIRLNGTLFIGKGSSMNIGAADAATAFAVTTYKFAVGDYVEALVYQTSGGALNVLSSGNFSPEFSATWLTVG